MILLKLDGIEGDCSIADWIGYITLSSVSWEITREFAESGKMGTQDVNVGMADLPPISIGKSMDCPEKSNMKTRGRKDICMICSCERGYADGQEMSTVTIADGI